LVKWKAIHDINEQGISNKNLKKIICFLKKKKYKIFISSERKLPKEYKKYLIKKNYKNIFDLLAYSICYIGESPTMAMEAALLGTLSFWISSRINNLGYTKELQKKYKMLFCYNNFNMAFKNFINIIEDKTIQNKLKERRQQVLKDKIDVSKWLADFVIDFYNKQKEIL